MPTAPPLKSRAPPCTTHLLHALRFQLATQRIALTGRQRQCLIGAPPCRLLHAEVPLNALHTGKEISLVGEE